MKKSILLLLLMIPAIIIAKGHSNRLPNKNILPFCGLPLVEWSIIQASSAHMIDKVFLSTDSEKIADIGRKHNAEIIWRTDEASKDVTASVVIVHALNEIKKKHEFNPFLQMLPTSPCRHPDDIDKSIRAYNEYGYNTIQLSMFYNPKETVVYDTMGWHKKDKYCYGVIWNKNHRYLVGMPAISICRMKEYIEFARSQRMTDKKIDLIYERANGNGIVIAYVLAKWYQQYDIDDKDDFELCELLMERYILKGRGAEIYKEYAKEQKE